MGRLGETGDKGETDESAEVEETGDMYMYESRSMSNEGLTGVEGDPGNFKETGLGGGGKAEYDPRGGGPRTFDFTTVSVEPADESERSEDFEAMGWELKASMRLG